MATTKNNWSTDRISNVIISNLITSQNKVINIILIQDDCSIEFNTDTINLEPNLTFIADDITFKVYSKA